MSRQPMTPVEFDAACRELGKRCTFLSETSGLRSYERNRAVGGSDASKHLLGMARDFVASSVALLEEAADEARLLGLWTLVHDTGSGDHLHVQGLEPGAVPDWWLAKYRGNE